MKSSLFRNSIFVYFKSETIVTFVDKVLLVQFYKLFEINT